MSFDLFVYYKTMPSDFAARASLQLKAEGFDLPVTVHEDGENTRINIGDGMDGPLGLSVWTSPLSDAKKKLFHSTANDLEDTQLVERLPQVSYEMHFSNEQTCCGIDLMYVGAAIFAAQLDGGIYSDPQEDGHLAPDQALIRAKFWARFDQE